MRFTEWLCFAALGCMSSITSPSQLTVAAEGLVETVEKSVVNTVILRQLAEASDTKEHSQNNHSNNKTSDDHDGHGDAATTTLFYPVALLLLGCVLALFPKVPIPYTVMIFFIGVVSGVVVANSCPEEASHDECKSQFKGNLFAGSVQLATSIDAHFMLHLFLPILIFESASATDWHVFKRVMWNAVILAGPGLLLSTALTAVWLVYCRFGTVEINTDWEDSESRWWMALLFGAVLSATDPVAVVAILKDVGAGKALSVSVEAESLLNDGVAVVIFLCFSDPIYTGKALFAGAALQKFFTMAFGGLAWGIACGILMSTWLDWAYDVPMVELSITVFVAYMCFFVAEIFSFSGVLANVGLGLCFSAYGRFKISPAVLHDLHSMWELLAFVGNTLIFGLSGVIIGKFVVQQVRAKTLNGVSKFQNFYFWFNQVLLYLILNVIRAVVFLLAFPLLRGIPAEGYKLDWKGCVVSVWGALRGAVGLALAMIIAEKAETGQKVCHAGLHSEQYEELGCSKPDGNSTRFENIKEFSDDLVVSVCFVVLLTLLINSTTMKMVVNRLRMTTVSEERKLMFNRAMEQLDQASLKKIQLLKKDPSLHCVDWSQVKNKRFLPPLLKKRRNNSRRVHISENMHLALVRSKRRTMHRNQHVRREARRRFLVAVRASYQKQFKKALLSGTGFRVLMDALDAAFDNKSNFGIEWETICDSTAFLAVDEMVARTGLVEYADQAPGINKSKTECLKYVWKRLWGFGIVYVYLRFRNVKPITWYFSRRIVREIQKACDRASAYLIARDEACEVLSKVADCEEDIAFYRSMAANGIKVASNALMHCYRLFPEMTVSVETHRALLVVLTMQKLETKKLKNCGVLDEDEAAKVTKDIDRHIKARRNKHRINPNLTIPKKCSTLREVPWLTNLPDDIFETVYTNASSYVYKINDMILSTGEVPRSIYVVASGTISLTFGNRQEYLRYESDKSKPDKVHRRRVMSQISDGSSLSGIEFASSKEKKPPLKAKQSFRHSSGAEEVNARGTINMRVSDTLLLQSQNASSQEDLAPPSLFDKNLDKKMSHRSQKLIEQMAKDHQKITRETSQHLHHRMSRHNSAWRVTESESVRPRTDTMTTELESADGDDEESMMTVTESSIHTYKAGQTILDIVAGQTVGTLAWIHDEDYASPFELRATSTSVEVYCIPIALIRESPKIREAMMTSAGQTIAFQVFTNKTDPSPFWHWSSRAIKKHLTTWKVIRPGASVVNDAAAELPSDTSVSMKENHSIESLGVGEEERERQPLMATSELESESKQQHAHSMIETGSVADTSHEWFLCNFIQHVVLVRGDIIKVEVADASYAGKLKPSYSRSQMQELIHEDMDKASKNGHRAMHLCSAPMCLVPSAEVVAHLDDKSVVYYIHVGAWLCLPDRADFHLVESMEDLKLEWEELTGIDFNNDFRNLLAGNTQDVIKLQRILKIWKRSMSASDVLSRKRSISASDILKRKRSQSASTPPPQSSVSPGNDSGILPPPPEPMPKLVLNEDAGDIERVIPMTSSPVSLFGATDDTETLFHFSSTRDDTSVSRRATSPLPGQLEQT